MFFSKWKFDFDVSFYRLLLALRFDEKMRVQQNKTLPPGLTECSAYFGQNVRLGTNLLPLANSGGLAEPGMCVAVQACLRAI